MPTILIAAPEPNLRALLRVAVVSDGREVLESEDGEAALKLMVSQRPDLVVLDDALPDLPGLELCRMRRLNPALADLKVVLILGNAQAGKVREALEAGVDDWSANPVSPNLLRKKVAWLLSSSPA